jgi:hypothetical protein
MKRTTASYWAVILALALCVPAAWAQQRDPRLNPPVAPLPPLTPGESSSKAPDSVAAAPEPAPARPDTRPLSGVEQWQIESGGGRSFLQPSFSLYQGADTNPRSDGRDSGPESVTRLSGRLILQRLWDNYEIALDYVGSGQIYSTRSSLNSSVHDFTLRQHIRGRRWSFLFSDTVNYSPDAARGGYGTGGYGFAGPLGYQPGTLRPLVGPSQSILTTRSARISNVAVGQAEFMASRRTSFTFGGSYGMLRFFESGFLESNTASFHGGYNYAWTPRDTVAVSYGTSLLRYEGTDAGINSHTVHVSYGRRITGRLALQLSAGPQITTFDNFGAELDTVVSWSVQSSLSYRRGRTGLGLSYARSTTEGSGVMPGAQTHYVRTSLSRQLSRMWSGSVYFGYSQNERLFRASAGPRTFHSWDSGFQVGRTVGRQGRMYLRYSAQRQTVDAPGCLGTCGAVGLRHVFGIGYSYQFRPIELE